MKIGRRRSVRLRPIRRGVGFFARAAAICVASSLLVPSVSSLAFADVAGSASGVADDAKSEARARFDRGLAFYKDKKLEAALAEFLLSRKLYPTRAASFNAAKVYRELGRHDEALELLEAIGREFPDLPPEDRAEIAREVRDVGASIGWLEVRVSEPDATIIVDGRERTPSSGRGVSVSAGTHVVRVHKDGFIPFEARIDVAAQATVPVEAKLGALTRGGRLAVTEDRGEAITVLVDGIAVGKTPWEGTVAVGAHTVALRGEGNVGSPPTPVTIRLNQLTKLALVAEPLACALRVEPTPRTATIAVDSVEVGRGVWEGPLRCGGHVVEVFADGFLSRSRPVSLASGPTPIVRETLERDPSSAAFQAKNPPRITVELVATALASPGFGGEITDSCTGACSSSPGLGAAVAARAGYRLGVGLGASLDVGALYVTQSIADRPTETRPYGLPPHAGVANDHLRVGGPTLGLSLSYAFGEKLPIVARLGAGVLLTSLTDTRSGSFRTPSGAEYRLPAVTESPSATSLYLDPEVRVGLHLFRGGTLDLGLRALVVTSLGSSPRWGDGSELSLGACPSPDPSVCSGRGVYAPSSLAGTWFAIGPTIGLRYER